MTRRPLLLALTLAISAGAAACASAPRRPDVCPEYRELRCVSQVVCDLDRERGCEVCRCSEWSRPPPPGYPTTGPGTPDRASEPPPAWTPQGAQRP